MKYDYDNPKQPLYHERRPAREEASAPVKAFKTDLTKPIKEIDEADDFVRNLVVNGEVFHFEDDVFDILWSFEVKPTNEELVLLDKRRNELFEINGFCPFDCWASYSI